MQFATAPIADSHLDVAVLGLVGQLQSGMCMDNGVGDQLAGDEQDLGFDMAQVVMS